MRHAASVIPAVLVALALAFALAGTGCGNDGAASSDDAHGTPGAEQTHTGPPEQAVAGEQ